MSSIFYLLLCVVCAVTEGYRVGRSSMTGTGGASSSSSSSSSSFSSGSAGVGAGGYGGNGGYGGSAGFGAGNFMFPTQFPFFQFPNAGGAPYHDFNALYQQFLSSLYAAQAHAAQNPSYAPIFQQQITSLIAQQQAAMAQIPFAFPGGSSNLGQAGGVGSYPGASQSSSSTSFSTGGTGGTGAYPTGAGQGVGTTYNEGSPNSGTTYTSASVNYGPQGGYGQASAFPGGADGLGVRISEELPPPSGGTFGVFSSSSSGTSDINGKRTSFKTSTFGTNDNGKITFRTVNE
ncbi:hypothetical protein RUM44_006900 [Polyplax serrata]|uniref:Uncharacterized protein n=1 Tax=Polyplax serrata TaxID=468196 RepID=A0ABR1AJG0_POLSC